MALAGDAWLALVAGGVVVLVSGFLLEESIERVEPPLGYHFCLFCSTAIKDGQERCGHCNGLQEITVKPSPAEPQPNN